MRSVTCWSVTSMPSLSASSSRAFSSTSSQIACALICSYSLVPCFGNFCFWACMLARARFISSTNRTLAMWRFPTVATSSLDVADAPPPPPQPASTTAARTGSRSRKRKRPFTRPALNRRALREPIKRCKSKPSPSGGLAGGQKSIDQIERPLELFVAERHLALRSAVHRRVEPFAQLAELARTEDQRADCGAPTAEDEVVGAEPGEFQLRLLDVEQMFDGLRERAVAVLGRELELAEVVLVLDEREPAVEVDLERLRGDVGGGHVGVDARVHPHGPRGESSLARELRDDLVEHLDVELEAERRDVSGLLRAEQVAGAADLQVAHRDREARAELGVVCERREPRSRFRSELARLGIEQVGVRRHVATADAPADLVELGEPELVGALDDQGVRLGDVEARLDDGGRDEHVRVTGEERQHLVLELALPHLPVRDEDAQLRKELR